MGVLVTGANGFVGSALCERLVLDRFSVRCAVRALGLEQVHTRYVPIGNISSNSDWTTALRNVNQVVHLAARVHAVNDKSSDPLSEFRLVNVEGTANLARQAAAAGVSRFIFVSSIKVNGECTEEGKPFTAYDTPAPKEPYGISKHEAEKLLCQIAAETGMEVVIIRPPLVYGPRVKANFASLMQWLTLGVPLPLAAVTQNRRSLVALDNLIDLIVICLDHPAAANQTFLVSDGEDLSTANLLQRTGAAMGHPARLVYLPSGLLRFGATLLGRRGVYVRMCGSLQLDISKTRQLLGWTPPVSVDEGLFRAAEGFRS